MTATGLKGHKLIVYTKIDGIEIKRTVVIDRVLANYVYCGTRKFARKGLRFPTLDEIAAVERDYNAAVSKANAKSEREGAARRKATIDNPHWCDAKFLCDYFGSKSTEDVMKLLTADNVKQLRSFVEFTEKKK